MGRRGTLDDGRLPRGNRDPRGGSKVGLTARFVAVASMGAKMRGGALRVLQLNRDAFVRQD
jgi:hypothetical protein